ncbi:hydrolase [Vampirovibrio sp.]|uniref:hydrolase n=1 Tax=Vampirovibrio sp. TaxID=2717857 RepID=UPI0035931E3E
MDNDPKSRLLSADNTLLLIVDIQEKLLSAMENPEKLIEKVSALIQGCTALNIPIVVSEQVPHKLGPTAKELLAHLPDETTTWAKTAFGCVQDANIQAHLSQLKRKQVILCGLETHVCVSQTAHQLLSQGHQVHLITDACQSRHKKDHKTGLSKMTQSGVIPSSVEMALFEMLASCEHAAFRQVQSLIK